jgi:hypothetical protein
MMAGSAGLFGFHLAVSGLRHQGADLKPLSIHAGDEGHFLERIWNCLQRMIMQSLEPYGAWLACFKK